MWIHRLSSKSFGFPFAGALLAASASLLSAQGAARPLFEWRGRVDREVQIAMRGRDAWIQSTSRTDNARTRPVVSAALPRTDGLVRVRLEDGRGEADVIQQPSGRNDYTAIVRVRDRSAGADSYRLSAYWENSGRGNGSDNGWGNGPDGRRGGRDGDDRDADDRNAGDRNGSGWGRGSNRYGQNVLRWSGSVDDALEIRIQGDRISYRNLSGKGVRNVHAEMPAYGIPRDNVELRVQEREGRGDVYVAQQPTARNGYTAVIRITDPRPSFGFYDFDVTWRDAYGGWGRGQR